MLNDVHTHNTYLRKAVENICYYLHVLWVRHSIRFIDDKHTNTAQLQLSALHVPKYTRVHVSQLCHGSSTTSSIPYLREKKRPNNDGREG